MVFCESDAEGGEEEEEGGEEEEEEEAEEDEKRRVAGIHPGPICLRVSVLNDEPPLLFPVVTMDGPW